MKINDNNSSTRLTINKYCYICSGQVYSGTGMNVRKKQAGKQRNNTAHPTL